MPRYMGSPFASYEEGNPYAQYDTSQPFIDPSDPKTVQTSSDWGDAVKGAMDRNKKRRQIRSGHENWGAGRIRRENQRR